VKSWATTYAKTAAPAEMALIVATDGPVDTYSEWVSYVIEYDDGHPSRIVGSDGGEPEDQTLVRDWSWIVPALERAYEDGRNGR
jgi:hypothetical protein